MRSMLKIWILMLCVSFSFVYAQNDNQNQTQNGNESDMHHEMSPAKTGQMVMIKPSDLKWMNGPEGLPAGAKITVLEGDPSKSGPFTVRVKFPANYVIKPHWHSNTERISVISGDFYMGQGETYDQNKVTDLPAQGFILNPKGNKHYAFTKQETILQLSGNGPFDINYVNPSDDPRSGSKKNQ